MAYYRRYRRGGRRYRRKNRLSSYRIATRTSARAQSKQIYALNRRINYIQRMTKPQTRIKIYQTATPLPLNWNSSSYIPWNGPPSNTGDIVPPLGPTSSSTNVNAPINDFARLRSLHLVGTITLPDFVWDQNDDATPHYQPLIGTVFVRITVVQLRASRQAGVTVGDIYTSGVGDQSMYASTIGPLQNGVSRTVNILSDKRYRLDYSRPTATINTRLKYLLNYYRDSDSNANTDTTSSSSTGTSSETHYKGTITVFYSVWSSVNTVLIPTGSDNVVCNLIAKLAYVNN